MSFYATVYNESQESFTIKYGTDDNSDIESVLKSIIAYKKLLQRSVLILAGDNLRLNQDTLPDIILSINKHHKGSDVFDLLLKLTPEKYQQRALLGSFVLLCIGSVLFTANQILDLYIKIGQINEKDQIEAEFENFKNEINNKIQTIATENKDYKCPTSPLMMIDYTQNDYEEFIKPLKDNQITYIDIIQNGKLINHFNANNTKELNLNFNEDIVSSIKVLSFVRADVTNNKKWKVMLEGQTVMATIKDNNFYKKLSELDDNIFHKEYKAEITEYWKREKGEEILKMNYIDINKIINP